MLTRRPISGAWPAPAQGVVLPEEASSAVEEELQKLNSLEKNSSEFNVTRSYLDWLTSVPWGTFTEENFEISRARDVLERVSRAGCGARARSSERVVHVRSVLEQVSWGTMGAGSPRHHAKLLRCCTM